MITSHKEVESLKVNKKTNVKKEGLGGLWKLCLWQENWNKGETATSSCFSVLPMKCISAIKTKKRRFLCNMVFHSTIESTKRNIKKVLDDRLTIDTFIESDFVYAVEIF